MTARVIHRLPQACVITGRKTGSHYLDIRDGVMTPGVVIGPNAKGWPDDELNAINSARIAGAAKDEQRKLVQFLLEARKHGAARTDDEIRWFIRKMIERRKQPEAA